MKIQAPLAWKRKKLCIISNDSETPQVFEVTEQDRREFYVSPLAFKTSHYSLRVSSFAKMDCI